MKQKRHLLATRLLLSLLAVLTASTAWADSAFSGGSGTQADPYKIASTTDLNQLATDVNGGNDYSGTYFVLTADIKFTYSKAWDVATTEDDNNFVAIGGDYDGYNRGGTVANSTSAATLTIPFDAYGCYYYGAIAGYNDRGTLRDNLAIGATVPAADSNIHGAIVGRNSGGTLQHNYYTACQVAGEPNATGKGCENADVAENDGAVPALRDQADNTRAIALLAALASTDGGHTPVDLGWGAGKFPLQLAVRTLTKDGNWNTLCLPFNVNSFSGTPLDGATVKELDKDNSNLAADGTLTLTFTEASSIEAGTPYIVKWESASGTVADPVFQDVAVTSTTPTADETTDGNVRFEGQYSPFTIDADNINEILYVASGNKIGYSKSARTLKSFRAHFWVKPNDDTQAARMINIDFGEGETTSITTTDFTDYTNYDGAWYTLDGRKLDGQPTAKGVYVKNGKKVIIK